ncbi:hypothetical protein [Providencia sp. JUb39]|nr:hypothetical protein [Providencia sp. JUb39]MBC5791132.1 hypothetical protein [Providencia sp. JUb39]
MSGKYLPDGLPHNRCCGKCGERVPITECCLDGDSECWLTRGWNELKLVI